MKYSIEIIESVKHAYLNRKPMCNIAQEFAIPVRTLYTWVKKLGWVDLPSNPGVEQKLDERILALLAKKTLSEFDINLLKQLQSAKLRELRFKSEKNKVLNANFNTSNKTNNTTNKESQDPKSQNDNKLKGSAKKLKAKLADLTQQDILKAFKEDLFTYQLDLYNNSYHRTRNILKSRQIGLTWYFAREAVTQALLTGENHAFLSASKAQAAIFNGYIKKYLAEKFDIEVKGSSKILLPTPKGTAQLDFLSTNSSTAQGYSGHLYIDEYFWIKNFEKLKKVASAIASHRHLRKTYFSTPSTKSHDGFHFWSGGQYNEVAEKRALPTLDLPKDTHLRKGWLGPDKTYRKIITIKDALKGGCDFLDIKQLELEYAPDDFAQLFMCEFIDESQAVFSLDDLLGCAVDDYRIIGFDSKKPRPFGFQPVWIGYDPSRTRDSSVISVVAPPKDLQKGKFRVLELITLHNMPWQKQAQRIKHLTEQYTVEHISIDRTGSGFGVYEDVQKFFPKTQGLHYNPEIKTKLVLNAQTYISENRIEWSSEHRVIAQSFLMIKKIATDAGISYKASRDTKTGHADAAWSIMHALYKNGLSATQNSESSYIHF